MKTALILGCVALGFVGCSTNHQGGEGPAAETTEGRAYGWESDVQSRDPRGPWENWRYGGTPSRVAPREPVKTAVPGPSAPPPPAAPSGGVGAGVQSTTTPSYIYYDHYQRSEVVVQEPHDPRSFWDRFRYEGGPDQTAPRLPLDPVFPPAPITSSYDP
jgi:hypothetical protein